MFLKISIACIFSLLLFSHCVRKKEVSFTCGVDSEQSTSNEFIDMPDEFKKKCSICHSLTKDLTGPKLQGVIKRVPSLNWFENYLRNEDSLLKLGDNYTLKIADFSAVNNAHHFRDLNVKEVAEISRYLSQSKQIENKIITDILSLPEVKKEAINIEKSSNGERKLISWISKTPNRDNDWYYWVKIGEDNGDAFATHFNFRIDPTNLDVKFLEVLNNKLLSINEWRGWRKASLH